MVKPRFIKEVRENDEVIEAFEESVLVDKIASEKTIKEVQEILKNTVKRGSSEYLYT